jgi:hypothetical protein
VVPHRDRQWFDPVGLHSVEVRRGVLPAAELDETLAERSSVEPVAARRDDRLERRGDTRSSDAIAGLALPGRPDEILRARGAAQHADRAGEQGRRGEAAAGICDRGGEHFAEREASELLVQCEPAVDASRDRCGSKIVGEGHRGEALGAQPVRVRA